MSVRSPRRLVSIEPLLIAAALFLAFFTAEAGAYDPRANVPFDSTVVRGTLDNGISYFIKRNTKPQARADLRLIVKAGSVDEDEDQLGLAHFAEHMLFNGTEEFAGNEIIEYLESIGARFGADLNAYTSFDETVYMLHVPTDEPSLLRDGVRVLSQFAAHATFDSTEVEKERGVVLDEWRRGRGAMARIRDEQLPIVLRGSRYADRLPIGKPEIIENASRDVAYRYYKDWYRPERMGLVVVGDFQTSEVERLIREAFSSIPPSQELRERVEPSIPAEADTAFTLSEDAEVTRSAVDIGWKRSRSVDTTYNGYRQALVRGLAVTLFNDRLAEVARQAEPPFLGGGLSVSSFGSKTEIVELQAGVKEGGEALGLEGLLVEFRRANVHGFLESELDRARRDFLAGLEATHAEREKTPSTQYVGELTRHFLDHEPVPGIESELQLAREMLPGISALEVSDEFRELSEGGGTTVTATRPSRDDLVEEDELRRVMAKANATRPDPYVDSVVGASLLTNPLAPGKAKRVADHPEIGVSEWTLENGVRFFLKKTEFQDDEVTFVGTAPGGYSLASNEDLLSAQRVLSIVGESGFGGFSAIDLGKILAGKVASCRPFFDERQAGLGGSATVGDVATALELAVLQMTAPNRDEAAFRRVLERLEADVRNRDADPGVKYQDRLVSINTQDHPRTRPLTLARIPEIRLDTALTFYKAAYSNPANFTFFFAGNIDETKLVPEIERTLGSIPSKGAFDGRYIVHAIPLPEKAVHEVVRAGVEPKSQTVISFASYSGDDPDEWHRMRTLTSILSRRLREELREALGATYGVGVSYDRILLGPDQGRVRISFGCDPAVAEKLGQIALDMTESLRNAGPTAEEVEVEKTLQYRELESSLEQNGFWIRTFESLHARGRPLQEALDRRPRIEKLTVEALAATAKSSLNAEARTWVAWIPEQ